MGLFISIPIGILYFIINKNGINILTKDPKTKFFLLIFMSIFSLILAMMFFNHIKSINYGLVLGCIMMTVYSIVSYWNIISDISKLTLLFALFISLIGYSYLNISNNMVMSVIQ